MKRNTSKIPAVALMVGCLAIGAGCNRQTRGNADANGRSRAATPEEGGATSTKGAAGESKNFGDTRAKQQQDGTSPSASPTGLSKDAQPGQAGGGVNPPSQKLGTDR